MATRPTNGSFDSAVLRYESIAKIAAQALTLAGIAYAAWRYGATDPLAYCHVAVLLGIATVVMLTCKQTFLRRSHHLPVLFLILTLLWIGYATVQRSAIAGWLPAMFPGVVDARNHFGADSVEMLQRGVQRLDETPAEPAAAARLVATVMPEETRQSSVPFLLACVAAVLSALLFNTRRTRNIFLWAIIINASALAFWGIVQKAGGSQQILPGIENTFGDNTPFASFVYKNAGAAALLPALAAIAAILYRGSGRSRNRDSQYQRRSGGAFLLETKSLILISFATLLLVGLAVSLSRGAWLAAAAGCLAISIRGRLMAVRRHYLVVGAMLLLAGPMLIGLTGLGKDVRRRADQVSLEHVSADLRWSQWRDGFSTAIAHFPSGSGLGTYGYATLPYQSQARAGWFREAHNQYLEVLTESGLIGIALLLGGIGWFSVVCWRLTDRHNSREKRSWGLLGIGLLVAGGVQSVFDFVLVIPANLILYASLIAIVGAVERKISMSPSKAANPSQNHSGFWWNRWNVTHSPAAWCGIALVLVVCSYRAGSDQWLSERVLVDAAVTQLNEQPSDQAVAGKIAALSAAIEQQPANAVLYETRAHWHLAQYRLQLLRQAEQEETGIGWNDTKLENIFAVLLSQDGQGRQQLLQGLLRDPDMRRPVASAMSDLSTALAFEPLSPQTHLSACSVAPLASMPVRPWLQSSAALSNNSSMLLYLNGWLALQSGETEIAIDQWSKSLQIDHAHLSPILELSQQAFPAIRMVNDLIPADRPDLFVRLLKSTATSNDTGSGVSYDSELAEAILDRLRSNEAIESGNKHSTIARVEHMVGDFDSAVKHWELALRAQSREPSYRLEYSQSLRRLGKNDEALRQAVLGQTLNPVDKRFQRLAAQIRHDIRYGNHR